jgi:ATP-dependent Clp protease, protease subunit
LYVHHTGQKLPVVEKSMERDNFMSPEDALKFGLIDSIVDKRTEPKGDKEKSDKK